MYINRKTGELVEAEFNLAKDFWVVGWEENGEYVYTKHLSDADFQEQYGEALICPVDKRDCGLLCKGEHCGIHSKLIDCGITCEDKKYPCIPYIPEQKDPDEGLEVRPEIIERLEKSKQIPKEKLLTSEQMREKLGIEQSNLMLSDEEICSKILHCGKSNIETCRKLEQRCDYLYDIKSGIRAELDHLAGLGIVYVVVGEIQDISDSASEPPKYLAPLNGSVLISSEKSYQHFEAFKNAGYKKFIPLSDYKGEK